MEKQINRLLTIGELSSYHKVPVSVIRFWEKKFAKLVPIKKDTGIRYYNKEMIELVSEIKKLLYEKKFSIEGANLFMNRDLKEKESLLKELRDLQNEIKNF